MTPEPATPPTPPALPAAEASAVSVVSAVSAAQHPVPPPPWSAVAVVPGHPLAVLDGQEVGDDVRLLPWIGPPGPDGARPFRLYLDAGHACSEAPVASGRYRADREPAWHWAALDDWSPALRMSDGRVVEVPGGIEARVYERLAALLPPGGALSVCYDLPVHDLTARALAARVPAAATPLGALLRRAGCAADLRDRYGARTAEGGRRLAGVRPRDAAHRARADQSQAAALARYLADESDRDWGLDAVCRPIARATLAQLTGAPGPAAADGAQREGAR